MNRPKAAAAMIWLVAILLTVALSFVVPGLVVVPLQHLGVTARELATGWGSAAFAAYSELVYGLSAAVAWHTVWRRWWVGGRWRWQLWTQGFWAGLVLAVLTTLAGGLLVKFTGQHLPTDVPELLSPVQHHPGALVASLFVFLVVAPIMEEWLFRGALQTSLVGAIGAPAAIGIVALIFSGLHELDAAHPSQHPWIWLSILPLALLTGIVRHRTNSMSGNLGIHIGFNAWGVALIALGTWH